MVAQPVRSVPLVTMVIPTVSHVRVMVQAQSIHSSAVATVCAR